MSSPPEHGTRERILEVAEAFLGERGYHGTRLHQIAERVGIQKASLFHYFPSKEQLYRAVLDEGFGHTEQAIRRVLEGENSPLEKVRALVAAYVETVAAHPARTKILLRQSLGDAPVGPEQSGEAERVLRMVTGFVAEAQQAKIFAPIDPTALVLAVMGMVAFFFASVPVVAPAWLGDPSGPDSIERVKHHVTEIVERCLTAGAAVAAAANAIGALAAAPCTCGASR